MLIGKMVKWTASGNRAYFRKPVIMAIRYCTFIMLCVLMSLLYPASGMAEEGQKAFNEEELNHFCHDMPIILNAMTKEDKEKFFRDIIMNYPHAAVPGAIMRDARLSLSSSRLTYILFHTILAGIIEDMGGFGEGRLAFMEEQREKVKANPNILPMEKKRMLAELDSSIGRLHDLIAETSSIPRSELVLLWQKKRTLNALLRGKVPIRQKHMATQH